VIHEKLAKPTNQVSHVSFTFFITTDDTHFDPEVLAEAILKRIRKQPKTTKLVFVFSYCFCFFCNVFIRILSYRAFSDGNRSCYSNYSWRFNRFFHFIAHFDRTFNNVFLVSLHILIKLLASFSQRLFERFCFPFGLKHFIV
jgi:hypothetical protein